MDVTLFEIERKFLVAALTAAELTLLHPDYVSIEQFYINADPDRQVRVRITRNDRTRRATLTVKGPKSDGAGLEIEAPIAIEEAEALASLRVGSVVRKRRHTIPLANGLIAELDIFEEPRHLLLVEVELSSIGQNFDPPGWFGREVTNDPTYGSVAIAMASRAENR